MFESFGYSSTFFVKGRVFLPEFTNCGKQHDMVGRDVFHHNLTRITFLTSNIKRDSDNNKVIECSEAFREHRSPRYVCSNYARTSCLKIL